MGPEKFSIRQRVRSFAYAIAGLRQFVNKEHNARIHLFATFAVVITGFLVHVSYTEAAILVIVTGLVWVAEILNTCIERLTDLITLEQHPQIKIIKDLSAGAVLVAAIVAVVTGLLIIIPKII